VELRVILIGLRKCKH